MNTVQYYNRNKTPPVVAIQLSFKVSEGVTKLFSYEKWGDTQSCKPGDWLVKPVGGSVYTIDQESFAATYTQVEGAEGLYEKTVGVYAFQATEPGSILTKEGITHYEAGFWVAYNSADLSDGYAMADDKFRKLYEVP